ncbi:type IX secretion system sortase PorU [Chitinophaga agrisoli]|uniref:Type IX secretion system sortase PorU n=1 Tax=Chitinophaga agrisoli TaxID=2607653 RepID=A0A5B2W4F2_9BACT|nr:type IX secretion system sortase PorU [Chitinophaga agrisoli]KAA2245572.1 type IX secretion system sortase PorU [Chitinophaga agrisoli]
MKSFSLLLLLLPFTWSAASGQRTYAPHSVLASGTWYKLAITQPGIYKITVSQLNDMGINTQALAAGAVRLFGRGGQPLPEDNSISRPDDLPQIALQAADGGDGLLNGDDYLLFYAPGPHSWTYAAATRTYTHQYNIYSDTAWYFLNIGQNGLRIATDNAPPPTPTADINAFDYRAFYEKDSVNLVNSGKQWWGPVFSNAPGGTLSGSVNFNLPSAPSGAVQLRARAAARSSGSNFNISVNQTAAGSLYLLPVSGNIFEAFATAAIGNYTVNNIASPQVQVNLQYSGGNGDQGWLDYLELQARCALALPAQEPLFFRDGASVAPGAVGRFTIDNTGAATQVWDITVAGAPVNIPAQHSGTRLQFVRPAATLREYVAFNPAQLPQPAYTGQVANQDLHAATAADMIIITTPALQSAAARLAAYHTAHDQLQVTVALTQQIYNEFAAGSPDPTAIRDFVKMYYDKAGGAGPRYLLLFGDASYDYRNRVPNNTNLVPTWQSDASLDFINAYPSDDFYGFLDDGENITDISARNLLDLGIGRLPAQTPAQAQQVVDKIIGYHNPANFGAWRNRFTFVADDGDDNLHLQDAEAVSDTAGVTWPQGIIDKIYLDAYPKESGAGGARYPQVNSEIQRQMNNGNLVWNYTGHGSYSRLAEEVVVDNTSIQGWDNAQRLPLMITATCDFAPFDNPGYTSLGEQLLLQAAGGAIGLMTTTRAVFAYSNRVMNTNYFSTAFTPLAGGRMPSLGEAAMLAKNLTYNNLSDVANNRKFQLLGDPALTLAFPRYRVVTDTINGKDVKLTADTLKALGRYTVSGHIADEQGAPLHDFNGTLEVTVYDKPLTQRTRGNDAGSEPASYSLQQQVLFRGQQSVRNGRFSVTFVVPKDIDYKPGAGKISYYAASEDADAGGYFDGYQVGGTAANPPLDTTGPQIQAFMDTELFRNGGPTGTDPVLLVNLRDSSGINTSGYGIGHDMVAVLDTASQYFILNDFYTAALDDYRKGSIRFPFYNLAEGPHTLYIKAWDTYNNSSTATLQFVVTGSSTLDIPEVGNYPNPFHDQTRFFFTHNQQGEELQVTLQVFTVTGQLVKTKQETIKASGNRYDGMLWDGAAGSGAKVPPGIYIYRLTVSTKQKTKISGGKLILF